MEETTGVTSDLQRYPKGPAIASTPIVCPFFQKGSSSATRHQITRLPAPSPVKSTPKIACVAPGVELPAAATRRSCARGDAHATSHPAHADKAAWAPSKSTGDRSHQRLITTSCLGNIQLALLGKIQVALTHSTLRLNASACRRAKWNTSRKVSTSSMASSQCSGCPPGLLRFGAAQPVSAASSSHSVRSPRRRSPAS